MRDLDFEKPPPPSPKKNPALEFVPTNQKKKKAFQEQVLDSRKY